jgi:hypothetical protein
VTRYGKQGGKVKALSTPWYLVHPDTFGRDEKNPHEPLIITKSSKQKMDAAVAEVFKRAKKTRKVLVWSDGQGVREKSIDLIQGLASETLVGGKQFRGYQMSRLKTA